ncbi:hypothetical protein FRC14_002619 [Serendipita sp. 396]|nr:hypothetical protein FRC14_002619 [Serendipita sp. 396]KAG8784624.1 hypothetical protein FRC15_002941 [Serendipita sp. 397]KAG8800205.1 hypothetical protein FRC16_003419 [Serendipita sp. 398]KAG8834911.1 hypothetical protein FRC18_001340 [Serendipita sp. 400]KAG8868255.1 hypothetical protein FRC20_003733 [Serendipita sp. 405]
MRSLISILTPITGTLLAASAVTAAPLEPRASTWTPAEGGCWMDSVKYRALQHLSGVYDDLTPTKCQLLCEDAGFSLAGVEYSRECYCGNTIMGNNRPTSRDACNMPCTGDGNQTCGGADAIQIYVKDDFSYTFGPMRVLEVYHEYWKTQCWRDSTSDRILKQGPSSPIPGDLMTVQKCIDGCAAAGYSSAGVEFGRECYCDNAVYPLGQNESIDDCNMPCTGDGTKACGGPDRILVYHKAPAPPVTPHTGVIEFYDVTHDWFLGYITDYTINGIATYNADLVGAERFTFDAPDDATFVQRAEMKSLNNIDGFPFLGLIRGFANADSDIAPGSYHYLFLGGTPHSAPGATPQTGPNSCSPSSLTWESSVWNLNITTGDITPQWINSDGSSPATYLFRYRDQYMYGSGDLAAFNSYFKANASLIKLRFKKYP